MRHVALLLLALTCSAAELEQITLTDGRRLVGYYDEAAGKLTIEGPPKAVIWVAGGQVASRSPYVRPVETDPIKRDEAECVRLEAERASAIADAARLRQFANGRSGKDAESALAQSDERMDQAATIAEKIDAIRARMPKRDPPTATATSPSSAAVKAAFEKANAMRDEAIDAEFIALRDWLSKQDLSQILAPTLGDDPRRSDIEAARNARVENDRRERLSVRLKRAMYIEHVEDREKWISEVRSAVRDLIDLPEESPRRQREAEQNRQLLGEGVRLREGAEKR